MLRDDPNPLPSHCPAVARKVHFFVEQIHVCRSVRQCFLLWHFVSLYIGFPLRYYAPSMFGCPPKMMMDSLARLQNVVEAKAKEHSWDYLKDWRKVVEAMAYPKDDLLPSARSSALLMHYAAGARAMEAAAPFADLLACFAKRQGLSFVHDKTVYFKSKWLGYSRVGILPDAYILGASARLFASDDHPWSHRSATSKRSHFARWNLSASAQNLTDAGRVAGRFLLEVFQTISQASHPDWKRFRVTPAAAETLLVKLSSKTVWRRTFERLGVVSGPPIRWVKAFAIEKALSSHEAVVYLDYDITVRPDCLGAARLIQDLFSSYTSLTPHIVVRDSAPGTDCMNTGFIAMRKSQISKIFLKLWRSKMGWPGALHGDQGPMAETILQLLDMERRAEQIKKGVRLSDTYGYESVCLPMLFPTWDGMSSWRQYCDCWQQVLLLQVGPFQNRTSRFIKFLDPRKMDVNFVPQHVYDLRGMRLLPWRLNKKVSCLGSNSSVLLPEMTPLLVHWAGMENRTKLMRDYLVRRFGVKPSWFTSREPSERCAALAAISPRVNSNCSQDSMGSSIEHVFEDWEGRDDETTDAQKMEATFAAALITGELPDKTSDTHTVSARFRDDLLSRLGGQNVTRDMTVLELGSYFGYTTSFLANGFRFVVAVDSQLNCVKHATDLLVARSQQSKSRVLLVNTLEDDLSEVAGVAKANGGIDVVFIDADHSFNGVVNDLGLALHGQLGTSKCGFRPRYIVLDDFYARATVRQAFVEFEKLGLLRRISDLGHLEGVLCQVVPTSSCLSSAHVHS